jgi:hypothetical protein
LGTIIDKTSLVKIQLAFFGSGFILRFEPLINYLIENFNEISQNQEEYKFLPARASACL